MKKLRTLITTASLALGIIAVADGHAATACSISTSTGAQVTVGGRALILPAEPPDCEGAVIARGEVTVCVQDLRGRLRCRPFAAGTTLTATLLGPVDGARGWLAVLRELLSGDVRVTGALNRGHVERALPTGTVTLAVGAIALDTTDLSSSDIESVDIVDAESGTTVTTLRGASGGTLSRAMLVPGRGYVWTIRSSVPLLDETSGRFRLADSDELAAIDLEVARIGADAGAGPRGRALMLAAWLQQRGLAFDARHVLRGVGR